jgi:hypothetical protein
MRSTGLVSAPVLALFLAALVQAQQKALGPESAERRGEALRAPRYLEDLEPTGNTGGVRLSADVDGDGDVDLLQFDRQHRYFPSGLKTYCNQGSGGFQLAHQLAFEVSPDISGGYFTIAQNSLLADVDRDGILDLDYDRRDASMPEWWSHVGPSGALVYLGLGDGSFGPSSPIATNGAILNLAVGDCDGDGDADLLVHDANNLSDYRDTLAWWHLEAGTWVEELRERRPERRAGGGPGRGRPSRRGLRLDGVLRRRAPALAGLGAGLGRGLPELHLDHDRGLGGRRRRRPAGAADVLLPERRQWNADGDPEVSRERSGRNEYSSTPPVSAWLRGQGFSFSERREWVLRDSPLAFADIDGDGDIDAIGRYLNRNVQFEDPRAGSALQYAQEGATLKTGGFHPVLGARGPLRPGSAGALLVRRGLGGAAGWLLQGRERTEVTVGGIDVFVEPRRTLAALLLGGTPGVAGQGTTELPLPPSTGLIGKTFTFQAVLMDPGASAGLSATNGLEVRLGAPFPFVER